MRPWSPGQYLAVGAVAVVVVALVAGIRAVGPPSAQRAKKLDEARVADLATIEERLASFAKVHHRLPDDLTTLSEEPGYAIPRSDPQSGRPYEYAVLNPDSYRLCAFFAARSTHESANLPVPERNWSHNAGLQCFNRRVDVVLVNRP
jgi:hypothetical protein